MNWKKTSACFLLVFVLIALSFAVLDKRLALLVRKLWQFSTHFSFFSTDIPDFLPLLVIITTCTAWIAFIYLTRKNIYNTHTRFFQLIAITVPLANAAKMIAKFVFGRINTRFWLQHPGANEFHWFHGSANFSGFPSGHMAVFTVLIIALSIFYPRCQSFYIACLTLLALALIVTNYHFLSDIIAGAYVGYIVHSITYYFLSFHRGPKNEGVPRSGWILWSVKR